jgi:hypothetical protein
MTLVNTLALACLSACRVAGWRQRRTRAFSRRRVPGRCEAPPARSQGTRPGRSEAASRGGRGAPRAARSAGGRTSSWRRMASACCLQCSTTSGPLAGTFLYALTSELPR